MSESIPGLEIATLRPYRNRRTSSFDRTGGNADWIPIAPGETVTLLDVDGPGVVRHIWMTINGPDLPLVKRDLVIRCFWDGQEHPSVEAPVGDFFGNGWGLDYNFSNQWVSCAPRDGKALVCYFPMPFRRHARITIENPTDQPVRSYYFYVDYDEVPSLPEDVGYFHAWYNQELTSPDNDAGDENEWSVLHDYEQNPTDKFNYLFVEAEGTGHYVGVNYYVSNPGPIWYGEGDDMFQIDGEPWPDLHGTGSEDYFNTSWSPEEPFEHPSFGLARIPGIGNDEPKWGWFGRTHCYRFHHLDPIRFQKSLRASIEHGHANCLTLELATVAYWYQTLPGKRFPPLPGAEQRRPRALPTVSDVHRWRDAFRKQQDGAVVWGDEGRRS
ncbi:DUF2961 domain-containing protein [Kamptonema cortianum]|nr:DUF2961 domain-containing protein [Kamptonema cortianum]